MELTTRKQFIKTVGGTALGLVAISGVSGLLTACSPGSKAEELESTSQPTVELPWKYTKLDLDAVAERAYSAYYEAGCMYGAFEGVIGELRDKVGEPYTSFPSKMMKYGRGGVVGWGTLCGVLNGAAAATYLIHGSEQADPIVHEMYAWYGEETLPNYKPVDPKFDNIEMSISGSPLCHISVTKWIEKTGFATHSPERGERCAWLTASTARHLADLLNKQADGTFAIVHAKPEEVAACLSCHGDQGVVDNVHIGNQTSCVICHDNTEDTH